MRPRIKPGDVVRVVGGVAQWVVHEVYEDICDDKSHRVVCLSRYGRDGETVWSFQMEYQIEPIGDN